MVMGSGGMTLSTDIASETVTNHRMRPQLPYIVVFLDLYTSSDTRFDT